MSVVRRVLDRRTSHNSVPAISHDASSAACGKDRWLRLIRRQYVKRSEIFIMKIEILYFDGCPNWHDAGERAQDAARAAGIREIEIEYRRVESAEDAATSKFAGSPTILINGMDAFDDAPRVAELACRVYRTEAGLAGLPSTKQLTAAMRARS